MRDVPSSFLTFLRFTPVWHACVSGGGDSRVPEGQVSRAGKTCAPRTPRREKAGAHSTPSEMPRGGETRPQQAPGRALAARLAPDMVTAVPRTAFPMPHPRPDGAHTSSPLRLHPARQALPSATIRLFSVAVSFFLFIFQIPRVSETVDICPP